MIAYGSLDPVNREMLTLSLEMWKKKKKKDHKEEIQIQ
jgi:hypothetical protein